MGVTEKGNYKRGQQEQGEDLLGKETNQKSETRSGRWAETGREERRNQLHTKAGMKLRCPKAVIPLLPARHLGKSTSRSVLPLSVLALTLQKTTVYVAQSQLRCPFCRGLPMADQSSPALLMVGVGISVMPHHRISAFSICAFKNQHKNWWRTLLILQTHVLQSSGCLPNPNLILLRVMIQSFITHLITVFSTGYVPRSGIRQAR